LTVTASFTGGANTLVCRTRDVSEAGLFLETGAHIDPGTRLDISLLDDARGEAIEVTGEVMRYVEPSPGVLGGFGVQLESPGENWLALVDRMIAADMSKRTTTLPGIAPRRRLRVLVVGDEARRRGALALYVKSGWDVRFASDLDGTTEALRGFKIDAVIAEHDLGDPRWPTILEEVRTTQPIARRIVRAALKGATAPPPGRSTDLVHRVVDLDGGIDVLLDALTFELT
jgi:hypothetical protein